MGVPRYLLDLARQEPKKLRLLRSLALGAKGGNRTVRSPDGCTLAVRRSGEGPPIVCVHGTVDGISAFCMLELELAGHHQVWVYDRRGRGGSGDPTPYGLDRDVEDLRAVVDEVGEPPHVVGHSLGAVVALRAAVEGMPVRSLVLYEPPLYVEHVTAEQVDRIRGHIERGDHAGALRTMAVELAGAAPEQIDVALSVPPVRKQLFDGLRSTPRELDALRSTPWPEERLPLRGVPTLFLRGERTAKPVYPSPEQVGRWVEGAEVDVLPGQDHLATSFGPRDLASRILRFVGDH